MNRTGLNNNFKFNSTVIRMLIVLVMVFVIVAFLVPGELWLVRTVRIDICLVM